jgi:ankyrin repeat protein
LHVAAGSAGSECLKFLLSKGEFPNQISNEFDRATPLHFGVLTGNVENVKILLKYNANPNAKDNVSPLKSYDSFIIILNIVGKHTNAFCSDIRES